MGFLPVHLQLLVAMAVMSWTKCVWASASDMLTIACTRYGWKFSTAGRWTGGA